MKKFILLLATCLSVSMLSGCTIIQDSEQPRFGNIGDFQKIHLTSVNKCYPILGYDNWGVHSGVIRVELADHTMIQCSNGTYILVQTLCPICDSGEVLNNAKN